MLSFGVLNINKPTGITSRSVVNHVDRLVRPASSGHAGTLDPLASGVLVLCIGRATRLIEYIQRMPKTYVAKFLLGRTSETEDVEGEVTLLDDPPQPTVGEIEQAAQSFLGQIEQRPPAFSALKVNGRRAYDLARAGEPVELAPRTVRVDRLDVVEYRYPELTLHIECGSGTYVRSLGRDLAESLGTGAVMSELVRTAIGDFHLDRSSDLQQLTIETIAQQIQPATCAIGLLPRIELGEEDLHRVSLGQTIDAALPDGADEVAALDSAGRLRAILVPRSQGGLRPRRNFPISE